jgi:hypothetical protein
MGAVNSLNKNIGHQEHSYWEDFKALKGGYQFLTILTGIVVSIFTLGIGTYPAVTSLIGRFKKIEASKSNVSQVAQKVDRVSTALPLAPKPEASESETSESEEPKAPVVPQVQPEASKPPAVAEVQPEAPKPEAEVASLPQPPTSKPMPKAPVAVAKTTGAKRKPVDPKLQVKLINLFWDVISSEKFIQEYYNNKPLIINDIPNIIDAFIFFQMEKNKHGRFTLGPDYRNYLEEQLLLTLSGATVTKDEIKFPYRFSETEEVDRLPTKGDGSCAFHALLGEFDGQFVCNAVKMRKQFCDGLVAMFNRTEGERMLPSIRVALDNIYSYPEYVDASLYENIKDIIESYKNNDILSSQGRLDAFAYDERVFTAYTNHLRKIGTYLDQEELNAAAIVFKKRVRLFQRGWFKSDKDKLTETVLNPNGRDEICIYYTPQGRHYERATVNSPSR